MVTGGTDQWPYAFPASPPLSPAGQAVSDWGLAVDAPLTLADPDAHDWAGAADLLVAGLGGAGVAAALEALEQGLSVIALDRYEGGGSSAANGGVFYAGGGTSVQREAGVDDTAENMFAYLKHRVRRHVARLLRNQPRDCGVDARPRRTV